MEKVFAAAILVFYVIILAALLGIFISFPIEWCWNATMPYLFKLHEITWWQAWCLSFLSHCFIKSNLTTNK